MTKDDLEQFQNIIGMAKVGDPGSENLLREVCREAADKAPVDDLVRMAQLLHDIRLEAGGFSL